MKMCQYLCSEEDRKSERSTNRGSYAASKNSGDSKRKRENNPISGFYMSQGFPLHSFLHRKSSGMGTYWGRSIEG